MHEAGQRGCVVRVGVSFGRQGCADSSVGQYNGSREAGERGPRVCIDRSQLRGGKDGGGRGSLLLKAEDDAGREHQIRPLAGDEHRGPDLPREEDDRAATDAAATAAAAAERKLTGF